LAGELIGHAIQCSKADLAKAMFEQLGVARLTAEAQVRLIESIDILIQSNRAEAVGEDAVRYIPKV